MADLISKLIESIGERHVLLDNAVRDRDPGLDRANMKAGVLVCPADPDEVSAEHGIGIERRRYMHFSRSNPEIDVMRSIKATLDPKNILNPGKVLP